MINCVQESGAPKLHNFCTLLYMEVILMRIKYRLDNFGNIIVNHNDHEMFVKDFCEAHDRDPEIQLGLDEPNCEIFFAKRPA